MEFDSVEVTSNLEKLLGHEPDSIVNGVEYGYESEDGNWFMVWRRDLPLNGKWFYRVDTVDGMSPYSGFATDEKLVEQYEWFLVNF